MGRFRASPGGELFVADLSRGIDQSAKKQINLSGGSLGTLTRTSNVMTTYAYNRPIVSDSVDFDLKIDASADLSANHRLGIAALLPYPSDNWLYSLFTDIEFEHTSAQDQIVTGFIGLGKVYTTLAGSNDNNMKVLDVAVVQRAPLGHAQFLIQQANNVNANLNSFSVFTVGGIMIENDGTGGGEDWDCDVKIRFSRTADTLPYRDPIGSY